MENPAEMHPYKAHGTPDGEADHKDQGQQQRTPEAPIRKPDKRSPIRVETIKDKRSQRDRLGSESGISQSNTNNTMFTPTQVQLDAEKHLNKQGFRFQNWIAHRPDAENRPSDGTDHLGTMMMVKRTTWFSTEYREIEPDGLIL